MAGDGGHNVAIVKLAWSGGHCYGPGQYLGDVCPDLRISYAILRPIWSPFVIVSLLTSLFIYTATAICL